MTRTCSWRRVKRDFLYKFHLPRCDLLAWVLVKKLAPTYYRKLSIVLVDTGRYRELASWRKDFKRQWRKLEQTPITLPLNEAYRPNVPKWTCTCPAFVVSRFLICKHLVQKVRRAPPIFFLEVKRARTTPFWKHHMLTPLSNDESDDEQEETTLDGDRGNESDDEFGGSVDGSDDGSDDEMVLVKPAVGGLTFEESMDGYIHALREFADGLEYQKQFRDERMLRTVERELIGGMTRLMKPCLEKERRFNVVRGSNPTTWESTTSGAMFYRARPRNAERIT